MVNLSQQRNLSIGCHFPFEGVLGQKAENPLRLEAIAQIRTVVGQQSGKSLCPGFALQTGNLEQSPLPVRRNVQPVLQFIQAEALSYFCPVGAGTLHAFHLGVVGWALGAAPGDPDADSD